MNSHSVQIDGASELAHTVRAVLVDDCPVGMRLLVGVVGLQPHIRIEGTAQDGQEGFALVNRLQPDLVVTDLQMPVLDGLQLVERLRSKYPAMRLIIASADDGPRCREASLRHGADAFICKQDLPQELPQLLARFFRVPSNTPYGKTGDDGTSRF